MTAFRHDAAHWVPMRPRLPAVKEVMLPHYRVVEICAGAGGQSLGLEVAGSRARAGGGTGPQECMRHAPAQTGRTGRSRRGMSPARMSGIPPRTAASTCSAGWRCPAFRRSPSRARWQLGAHRRAGPVRLGHPSCAARHRPRARCCLRTIRGHVAALVCAGVPAARARPARRAWLRRRLAAAARRRLRGAAAAAQVRAGGDASGRLRVLPLAAAAFRQHPNRGRDAARPDGGQRVAGCAAAWAARRRTSIAPHHRRRGPRSTAGPTWGPTRAKRAWRTLGVDALGVADSAPTASDPATLLPKLTCEMVARIQGWDGREYRWEFTGRKTSNSPANRQRLPRHRSPACGLARPDLEAVLSTIRARLRRPGRTLK